MTNLVARGERVGLRPATLSDVGERYLGWMLDPAVTRFLESRFAQHDLDSLREFVSGVEAREDTALLAIVELESESHIGNIKLGPVDPHHRTADVGLLLGERAVWGRGFGTEAIRLATVYGFEQMQVRKLTASCYSGNVASAAAFKRAGWVEEGRRPAQFLADDGSVHDQVLFGIVRGAEVSPPGAR